MPNQNGKLYGLTILSPIIEDERATPSHDLQIRNYLASLPTDERSPFAVAPGTHLARLAVMDDVIYVGMPACEEHLKSKYLVFESNCDGDVNVYLAGLARSASREIEAIWSHCVGFPGVKDVGAFLAYMKACQLETTFFFAAVNDRTLPETQRALLTQYAVTAFIAEHQGMSAERLQTEFLAFAAALAKMPVPRPGSVAPHRAMKTGGHDE